MRSNFAKILASAFFAQMLMFQSAFAVEEKGGQLVLSDEDLAETKRNDPLIYKSYNDIAKAFLGLDASLSEREEFIKKNAFNDKMLSLIAFVTGHNMNGTYRLQSSDKKMDPQYKRFLQKIPGPDSRCLKEPKKCYEEAAR